jgi:hypothetical protein
VINLVKNKSVAVVCNGCSLSKNNYADFIDSHDIVIRMNHGGMYYGNYKSLVGNKLNVYATNCFNGEGYEEVIDFIENLPSSVAILSIRPLHPYIRKDFQITLPFIELFQKIQNPIHIITNNFYMKKMVDGYYNYSSGISVIMFLADLPCKNINVFGCDGGNGGYYYDHNNTIFNHDKFIENKILNHIKQTDSRIKFF